MAEVLRLAMCRGQPQVMAAADRLDNPVRWVHVIEFPDAARLLRGGELVLTTGIALPDEGPLLEAYVAGLAGVGASALAVELGRKYTGGLPAGFVAAAEARPLPLIVFQREVPFIEITEAVHAQIINDQLDQLRGSARLHEVFTDLAVAGAGPGEILRQASELAGRPLILEDLSHHVLACEPAGADPAQLLAGFEARSRAVAPSPRTVYQESSRLAGHHGGRARCGLGPGDPGLRRAAGAGRHRAGRAHGDHAGPGPPARPAAGEPGTAGAPHPDQRDPAQPGADPDQAAAQARALGVPVTGRQLIAAVLRSAAGGGAAGPGQGAGPGRGGGRGLPRGTDPRAGRLTGRRPGGRAAVGARHADPEQVLAGCARRSAAGWPAGPAGPTACRAASR